jgi:O-antigen ligase
MVLVAGLFSKKNDLPKRPLVVPLTLLTGFVLVTGVLSDYPGIVMESIFLFLAYIVIYFCAVATICTRQQERIVVMLITGTAVFISVIAYLKHINFVLPFWTYADLKITDYLTGTFGNHNHFSGYLEMAIPVTLGSGLTLGQSRGKALFWTAVTIFLVLTQALTLSRGGWLSTLSALVFMGVLLIKPRFTDKRHRVQIFFPMMFLLFLPLFYPPVLERITTLVHDNPLENLSFRLSVWEKCVDMIKATPFTGTGPGTFSRAFVFYNPNDFNVLPVYAHNDYLQFLTETGIFFFVFSLGVIHNFFKLGFAKMQTQSRRSKGITLGAMASVFAILVHSLFDFNLHIPSNALTFTILAALATSPVEKKANRHG